MVRVVSLGLADSASAGLQFEGTVRISSRGGTGMDRQCILGVQKPRIRMGNEQSVGLWSLLSYTGFLS
jgi:hypothetical protein